MRKIEITHWCNTNEILSRLQQKHTHTYTHTSAQGERSAGRQVVDGYMEIKEQVKITVKIILYSVYRGSQEKQHSTSE